MVWKLACKMAWQRVLQMANSKWRRALKAESSSENAAKPLKAELDQSGCNFPIGLTNVMENGMAMT